MKKSLLVMLALCAFQAFADSPESMHPSIWTRPENQSASTVYITPVVGVAAMALRSNNQSYDSDTGLSIGALAEFGQGMVTLQTGALYNQFGGRSGDLKLDLDYLSIPVAAKFNFMGNPEQTVFAKAGVMPGILVSSTYDDGFTSGNATGINTFDLPMVIGFGGALPISGNASLVLEADYVRSLFKVNSNSPAGSNTSAFNEGFLVNAGFNIAL